MSVFLFSVLALGRSSNEMTHRPYSSIFCPFPLFLEISSSVICILHSTGCAPWPTGWALHLTNKELEEEEEEQSLGAGYGYKELRFHFSQPWHDVRTNGQSSPFPFASPVDRHFKPNVTTRGVVTVVLKRSGVTKWGMRDTMWTLNRNCHNESFHTKKYGDAVPLRPLPLHPWNSQLNQKSWNLFCLYWIRPLDFWVVHCPAGWQSS